MLPGDGGWLVECGNYVSTMSTRAHIFQLMVLRYCTFFVLLHLFCSLVRSNLFTYSDLCSQVPVKLLAPNFIFNYRCVLITPIRMRKPGTRQNKLSPQKSYTSTLPISPTMTFPIVCIIICLFDIKSIISRYQPST